MKTCLACKTSKPIDEFWRNGTNGAGNPARHSRCIPCARIQRAGTRTPRNTGRPVGRPARVSAALVDFLSIECGWWNSAALADRIEAHERGVQRRLEELVQSGLIRRRVTLAGVYEYQADPWWMDLSSPSLSSGMVTP